HPQQARTALRVSPSRASSVSRSGSSSSSLGLLQRWLPRRSASSTDFSQLRLSFTLCLTETRRNRRLEKRLRLETIGTLTFNTLARRCACCGQQTPAAIW